MSEPPNAPDTEHEAEPKAQKRKGPPAWGVVLFLLLLGGLGFLNQYVAMSAPEIDWIENDLAAALTQVSPEQPRVFLYIYEPNDPVHERNEREVFTKRWARGPLQRAVCVRYRFQPTELESVQFVRRYNYEGTPLFLVLMGDGNPAMRAEGAVTEKEFFTYVAGPIDEAWERAQKRAKE